MRNYNGQPYLPYPGIDERVIVEEMLRDQNTEHWEACAEFVRRSAVAKAKNLPANLIDDMIQEIMFKIMKYLPYFRFHCAFKTWVNQVVQHHIIDEYRKLRNESPRILIKEPVVMNQLDESEDEEAESNVGEVVSAEDTFEVHEKIRIGMAALLEYANTTFNPARNRLIIQLVVFEGKTYEEAATAAGCNSPVVGHIIRGAQRFAREQMVTHL